MNMRRINNILMHGLLPFNFGMDYDDWLHFYRNNPDTRLCPTDPATWSAELIAEVNKRAQEENDLVDRLMKLDDEDFYRETERLADEAKKR